MRLFNKIGLLGEKSIIRSAGVLLSGTFIAQLISFLALPILTRLYSPSEFSVFAVFAAVLGILAPISCLRYEIAIPLPQDDKDAANLVAISILSSIAVSMVIFLVIVLQTERIIDLINQPGIDGLLFLLPVGVVLAGIFGAFQYWATRKSKFSIIARSRIHQAIGGVSIQLLLGWLRFGPLGLVLGHLINGSAGIFSIGRRVLYLDVALFKSINFQSMKVVAVRYSNFPKLSVIESLANNIGIQLPLIIIAIHLGGGEAGYLMLVIRLLQAPLGLIGGSLAQVYLSRAPIEHRSGNLDVYSMSVLNSVIKVAVGPFIFLAFVAPFVFGLVFGREWERAGVYAVWMIPWIVMQLLVFPLSMVFHVTAKQKTALMLQLVGAFFRVLVVLVAVYTNKAQSIFAYALAGFLFYTIYLCCALNAAGIDPIKFIGVAKKSIGVVIAWAVMGLVTATALIIVNN